MKLTGTKIIELIRRKNEEWTTYQIKKRIGVSIGRINQIYSQYESTGLIVMIRIDMLLQQKRNLYSGIMR